MYWFLNMMLNSLFNMFGISALIFISAFFLRFSFFVLYLFLHGKNNEEDLFPSHWPGINNGTLGLMVFEELVELLCKSI